MGDAAAGTGGGRQWDGGQYGGGGGKGGGDGCGGWSGRVSAEGGGDRAAVGAEEAVVGGRGACGRQRGGAHWWARKSIVGCAWHDTAHLACLVRNVQIFKKTNHFLPFRALQIAKKVKKIPKVFL